MKLKALIAGLCCIALLGACKSNKSASNQNEEQEAMQEEAIVPAQEAIPQDSSMLHEPNTFVINLRGNQEYILSPEGELCKKGETVQHLQVTLQPKDFLVTDCFYYEQENGTLILFYTDADADTAGSSAVAISADKKSVLWRINGLGFNLRLPLITNDGNYAYISSLGTIAKLNLVDGKEVMIQNDLYEKYQAFEVGADSIIFNGNETIFMAQYLNNKGYSTVDSVIFSEENGATDLRIHRDN